ncbi:hypothetical protein KL921_002809 [Ogataea angusta]|uniref:DWNN domain-containing protein n=1 Tax=Pichia angusta TaxID=870730 RepID=A0AAN6DFU6_PICAN|nr:uncharacterized protein KL928_003045 [Ogataea angusta]KAG7810314.1 hypothetical protein KL921_002809 [Ogataea angusta]KAG7818044.1 hypothetical protein KL928_003045 [Ogataea angusta]KAG7824495.1 hypothetical protein KL909_001717 [Ogataea angusta]KAG7828952.1 hypothetical protein KL920_002745 [Ogataea angusta]KAG7834248.1 hypothetical protein KL943_003544 [Ogataea angusta]
MAVIYYKFRSQRDDLVSTIKFDGTGLTVFELKREIIYANKLINSTDTDILLYHAEDPDKEYEDDNEVIQRASTVLVRRTSGGKKGRGNVLRYMAGKPRIAKTQVPIPVSTSAPAPVVSANEEDRIRQMFSQQDDQWNHQQALMATAQRVESNRQNLKLDENIPEYYICYKCGEKGKHHIRNCPKNNDPNWDGIRIKKTTGIPKSYLRTVDNPTDIVNEPNQNFMVNEEGKYVVAVADKKAWQRYQTIQQSRQVEDDFQIEDPEMRDPNSGKLWRSPVRTKCCKQLYSRPYIEDILLESDFKCPNCGQEDIYLDSLEVDEALQKKVDNYLKQHKRKNDGEEEPSKRQHLATMMPTMMPFMPFPAPMPLPTENKK